MYGDDGPDDYDDGAAERFLDAGWLTSDDADELRDLLKHVEWPSNEISAGTAALILIGHQLGDPVPVEGPGRARYEWARVKLNRHILV